MGSRRSQTTTCAFWACPRREPACTFVRAGGEEPGHAPHLGRAPGAIPSAKFAAGAGKQRGMGRGRSRCTPRIFLRVCSPLRVIPPVLVGSRVRVTIPCAAGQRGIAGWQSARGAGRRSRRRLVALQPAAAACAFWAYRPAAVVLWGLWLSGWQQGARNREASRQRLHMP